MKRLLWWHIATFLVFSVCLGCGGGQKAVVPTGPVAAPKDPPKTLPMIGPKIPHNQGK
jgi:hypothetical protein